MIFLRLIEIHQFALAVSRKIFCLITSIKWSKPLFSAVSLRSEIPKKDGFRRFGSRLRLLIQQKNKLFIGTWKPNWGGTVSMAPCSSDALIILGIQALLMCLSSFAQTQIFF